MTNFWKSAWEVFVLFVVPIGGGIPAGVLLAKSRAISWPATMLIYLISDIFLACVFEPVLRLFIYMGRRSERLAKFIVSLKAAVKKTTAHYGTKAGPLGLILIAFGADPMTGRAASRAAGHGFISGWTLAIIGDMMFFTVLMVSTLWLQSVLGNGTLTMFIILGVMIVVPIIVRKIRGEPKINLSSDQKPFGS